MSSISQLVAHTGNGCNCIRSWSKVRNAAQVLKRVALLLERISCTVRLAYLRATQQHAGSVNISCCVQVWPPLHFASTTCTQDTAFRVKPWTANILVHLPVSTSQQQSRLPACLQDSRPTYPAPRQRPGHSALVSEQLQFKLCATIETHLDEYGCACGYLTVIQQLIPHSLVRHNRLQP